MSSHDARPWRERRALTSAASTVTPTKIVNGGCLALRYQYEWLQPVISPPSGPAMHVRELWKAAVPDPPMRQAVEAGRTGKGGTLNWWISHFATCFVKMHHGVSGKASQPQKRVIPCRTREKRRRRGVCKTGCQGASIGSQPFTGLDLCTCLRLGWKDGGGITHYRVLPKKGSRSANRHARWLHGRKRRVARFCEASQQKDLRAQHSEIILIGSGTLQLFMQAYGAHHWPGYPVPTYELFVAQPWDVDYVRHPTKYRLPAVIQDTKNACTEEWHKSPATRTKYLTACPCPEHTSTMPDTASMIPSLSLTVTCQILRHAPYINHRPSTVPDT
ncbi:hypothetical protein N5P37_001033 [Trichoderma harzianum]|uniref:Uncharacterized protein n=1 Tax=Trichoderma harzianum CBS 226.95 TaxID=983964 RepID=A0A2T4AH02_TRIHA|nr:hypothetical protein M431DRAFT_529255 [Trichoderma harzianum CBS 226.95]KAK0766143.1 hypothetical protein N5P37_001033 [Trichoderma harzianum]PTB56371.1 hypothetical protein M431DRAFT_529255 [Trichoderma harzianum CBS 226.95]